MGAMTDTPPVDKALEYAYNNMARRPDAPELLQDLARRSADYRQQADAVLDCGYGDDERERIDLFRCGKRGAPLLVYLHGGYWQRGDKSIYSYLAEPFNAAGVDAAIVGYPLCPRVSMTSLVASVRAALTWLARNAEALGVDAARINLCGHSAGGQLTAMALATHWPDLGDDLPADLLKSAIPISGLYRLEPLLATTISHALHLTPAEVVALSPARLAAAAEAPMLVVVGGGETPAFFSQADDLVAAWSRPGLVIERHDDPGADHFDVVVNLGDPASALFRRLLDWLK
jgi:arylformamidase